mmetsp:Transcript_38682/g.75084  ORF Transcript_38682/g.75084 Transcript_38682/m.75084 type:complete len:95 (+) Transcript_38682:341-625(+)
MFKQLDALNAWPSVIGGKLTHVNLGLIPVVDGCTWSGVSSSEVVENAVVDALSSIVIFGVLLLDLGEGFSGLNFFHSVLDSCGASLEEDTECMC